MKKLFIISAVLLSCLSASAGNPIKNPFGKFIGSAYFIDRAPANVESFRSFIYDCKLKEHNAKDIEKMQKKYEKLLQKYPDQKYQTMCLMGMYYLRSDGKIVSYKEGFDLFKEGYDLFKEGYDHLSESVENLPFVNVMNNVLGWAYMTGKGTKQDYQKAYELFVNNTQTQEEKLYNILKNMKESDEDYDKILGILTSSTQEDFPELYLPLFYCSILGIGTQVNEDQALNWRNVIRSLNKEDYPILKYDQIKADMDNLIYARKWSQENQIDDSASEAFREGILKWYTNNDFEGAKAQFEKAIALGHLPSICELAMMFLDEDWGVADGKDQFESLVNLAISKGYIPASHILGLYMIEHWGKKSVFSSSCEGEAYPYIEAAAKKGFEPAKEVLALYDSSVYSRKTGLAAALSDMNEGLNDGNTEKKSLGENLKEVGAGYAALGAALSSGGSSNSSSTSTSRSVSKSSPGSSSSSGGSSDISNYVKSYEEYGEKGRKEAEKLAQEHLWLSQHRSLVADNIDFAASDWDVHLHMYNSHVHTLKTIKSALEERRQWAAEAGGNIPIGENERIVDAALAEDRPY